MALTFLIGGARSGKSSLAVRMASKWKTAPLFMATAEAKDDDMVARIAAHREERPDGWETVEAPRELLAAIRAVGSDRPLLIDCLSFWVANLVMDGVAGDAVEAEALAAAELATSSERQVIAVSNEVGMGIVPDNELGRTFRDVLGRVNAVWAARASDAFLVVAGLTVPLQEGEVDD